MQMNMYGIAKMNCLYPIVNVNGYHLPQLFERKCNDLAKSQCIRLFYFTVTIVKCHFIDIRKCTASGLVMEVHDLTLI